MRDLACAFIACRVSGLWFSFGLHVHFWPLRDSHIDLHLFWWIFTIGPYAKEIRVMQAAVSQEAE